MIATKSNGFGHAIYVQIPRIKQPIALFVLFRALGILSDREICDIILLDTEAVVNKPLLTALEGAVVDANQITDKESALKHIVSMAMYTPINMDKETGERKKRDFTVNVLNNDLFPHCRTS